MHARMHINTRTCARTHARTQTHRHKNMHARMHARPRFVRRSSTCCFFFDNPRQVVLLANSLCKSGSRPAWTFLVQPANMFVRGLLVRRSRQQGELWAAPYGHSGCTHQIGEAVSRVGMGVTRPGKIDYSPWTALDCVDVGRIKSFILKRRLMSKLMKPIHCREKWLVIAAIRFLRTCISMKDEFYYRYP